VAGSEKPIPGTGGDRQALLDLLARRPSTIDLDRAALEVAKIGYPDLDTDFWVSELDRHAFAIADRAWDLSDGEHFVQTTNRYLFGELGLRGNDENYYDADNSFLHRVLSTGLGMPISLSVVYIEIARRLAKPVVGIGLPGHFVVRFRDESYSTYIDPYNGGMLINEDDCRVLARVEKLEPHMLAPVDRRSIVMRMLNNLRQVYFSQAQHENALRLLDLLIAADPFTADEHKQRGVALMQLERMKEAVGAFRRYLDLMPKAADREQIQQQIQALAYWMAARN
jgi:regulator of sirC expression with transglutaminase-like and TPR domain